jgi:hypothetical protein
MKLDKPWNRIGLIGNTFTQDKEIFGLHRFVPENLFEEFAKAYMHPNRINKLLSMGYSVDDLDELL